MFSDLSKCKKCSAELVDAPDVERQAQTGSFTAELSGIPIKVCPRNCPGSYWYWLDFGVEALETITPDSPHVAKRKFGFFKSRSLCKNCNIEVENRDERNTFVFRKKLKKGNQLQLRLTANAVTCPKCSSSFLPAQTSSFDTYYQEMAEVISKAVTTDLIFE